MTQREHRRCEVWPFRNFPSEVEEALDNVDSVDSVESVDDLRRRNGSEGMRNVGNTDGGRGRVPRKDMPAVV